MYKNGKRRQPNNISCQLLYDTIHAFHNASFTFSFVVLFTSLPGVLNVLEGSDREIEIRPGLTEAEL